MKLLRMIFQVAFEEGTTTSYALASSQERGQMFVSPGMDVYKGQIIGIHQRPGDLSLNVCKKKAATNVRSNKEVSGENNSITSLLVFQCPGLEFYLCYLHFYPLECSSPTTITNLSLRVLLLIKCFWTWVNYTLFDYVIKNYSKFF